MPQDIPLEAGEKLVFTPPSLGDILGVPSFTLRSPTTRDRRFLRRLNRENGVIRHSKEAIREETLNGLRNGWTGDQFERFSPKITEYWERRDEFELQAKDEPDLVWDFDPEEETAIVSLLDRIAQVWPPLLRMNADNAEASDLTPIFILMAVVESWTGLETELERDRGYLTMDCAEALTEELTEKSARWLDEKRKGMPFLDLFVACTNRLYLNKDEEKNSPSPSPSAKLPRSSRTGSGPSKSPAAARANTKSSAATSTK